MKILVCVSKTPDTTTKITFTSDSKSLDTSNVQYVINPNDEHSLAHAMALKEKHQAEVTLVHVGEQDSEPVIRKCLAIGADKAIRINAKPSDALYVASEIAALAKDGDYNLIMMGCESIDYNGAQVPHQLGEMLKLPSFSYVTSFELDGDKATLKRDIDGGNEEISTTTPCVISVTKEIAEPKIPNMRGIMQARSKPLEVKEPAVSETFTEVVSYEAPPKKGDCKLIDADKAESLIDILHNEAKVI